MSDFGEICDMTAVDMAKAISERQLSPVEAMTAVLDRTSEVNGAINALCTVDYEGAMTSARKAEQRMSTDIAEPLYGVPISIKDLTETAGMRTTFGSVMFKDNVPKTDALVVSRIRQAGAIVFAKNNTPEFGVGINTVNDLFGATRNPWNLDYSAGGSSGGAGAAIVSGMGPIATGTDHGCSVRLPASYNGIVGLRPTPGRIPKIPNAWAYDPFGVTGPMARTVQDCAVLFDVMSGDDRRSPISRDFERTAPLLSGSIEGLRIAWSSDLGVASVDPEVEAICAAAVQRFENLGCSVTEYSPDFRGIRDIIEPLRAVRQIALYGDLELDGSPVSNSRFLEYFERAQKFTAADVGRAEALRSALWGRMCDFFDEYDLLITPTAPSLPFPVGIPFPPEINGTKIYDGVGGCMNCYAITMTGLPGLSIPAGISASGLPVGMQLVGPRNAEAFLLRAAYQYETAFPWPKSPAEYQRSIAGAGSISRA
jgi:amidase